MYLHGWQCSEIKLYVPHRRLTLRMDKVNQVLAMFGYELAPVRTDELNENS